MQAINTLISSKFKFNIIGQRTCEKCGASVNIIQTILNGKEQEVSECLNCENLAMKEDHEEMIRKAKARKHEIVFEKYSLIPQDLLNSTFDNYDPGNKSTETAKKKCVWYAEHFDTLDKNSLLLQGSYGVGKSHLSYAIAKYLKDKGKVVIFITMPELLNVLRDSYSKSDYSEIDILDACKNCDLLILDDLGAEYVKNDNGKESWAVDKIFTIINSRVDKPTIFTTNYKSDELSKKYGNHGGRIVSRMMNGTNVIKIDADDYRLKGW
ncbi:ATP-binding protein [Heyndrickxia oleronia]|uniref:ATP-binding protein n=1 Tax=Heyndrickxia oleronia TaxID=38875 RepID=UPI001B0D8975|nr:ATP-binding protein [Heyndrickxia oleronia]GIN38403.1 DNA replication protein DnaC [Heyndrickxia oleronia]